MTSLECLALLVSTCNSLEPLDNTPKLRAIPGHGTSLSNKFNPSESTDQLI
jgi:hypothetical protein